MPSDLLKVLEQVEKRFSELSDNMADPGIVSDRNRYRQLAKEHSDLSEMIRLGREYRDILRQVEENDELLRSSDDPELEEMARAEAEELEEKLNKVRSELEILLLPTDPDDHTNAIVEIRAGTGGEEAALFAADLYRM